MKKSSNKSSKTKTSLVFFGNERIATGLPTDTPILRSLVDAGYHIEAIVVSNRASQSRKKRELEVALFARDHDIPVITPSSADELLQACEGFKSTIAVLAAYGRMVPESVIQRFEHGIINIHPSLLPLHRGSIPIESVILRGEKETGVSVMRLVRAMDAGPVYAQEKIDLQGDETKEELARTLLDKGVSALLTLLPAILSGDSTAQEQDDTAATYDERISKSDGVIDWSKDATVLEREVRAYAEWPRSRTTLGQVDVAITSVHVTKLDKVMKPGSLMIETNNNCVAVACGEGTFLCIERLIPAGKKEMPIADFLRGYAKKLEK